MRIVTALCVAAASVGGVPAQGDGEASVYVEGFVVDGSSDPVVGAVVDHVESGVRTLCDPEGRFRIRVDELDAWGEARIRVRATGFAVAGITVGEVDCVRTSAAPSGPVVRIELEAGARVTGRVLDAAGRPAAGLVVTACGADPLAVDEVVTDGDGRFSIEHAPLRDGVVAVWPIRALPQRVTLSEGWETRATDLQIQLTDQRPAYAMVLVPELPGPAVALRLEGLLTDDHPGWPLPGRLRRPRVDAETRWTAALPDHARFEFAARAPGITFDRLGRYPMQMKGSGHVTVRRLHWEEEVTTTVSGWLLDPAGEPLVGTRITCIDRVDGSRSQSVSGREGAFELDCMRAPSSRIALVLDDDSPFVFAQLPREGGTAMTADRHEWRLPIDGEEGVTLRTFGRRLVIGRVVTPSGEPARGVAIVLSSLRPSRSEPVPAILRTARSDEDGVFRFGGPWSVGSRARIEAVGAAGRRRLLREFVIDGIGETSLGDVTLPHAEAVRVR